LSVIVVIIENCYAGNAGNWLCVDCCQEREKYETLRDELMTQKESEIEELQSNLSRLQAVSYK